MGSAGFTDSYPIQGGEDMHRTGEGNPQLTLVPQAERLQETMIKRTTSPREVPANPFLRTLATREPYETASADDRTSAETSTTGNSKPPLDVESFKNLLLTGTPTPRPPAQPSPTTAVPNTLSGPHLESGNSTEISSISHQPWLEPLPEVIQKTLQKSDDMAGSDEDESMGSVSEGTKGKKKKKKKPPPAPEHRHGKLVTPRQPQVVSFDRFAATEPATAAVRVPRDKPGMAELPPLAIGSQDTTRPNAQARPATPGSGGPAPGADLLSVQKKRIPPPVPLARRQSQVRGSTPSNRPRSSSSLTASSQHSMDTLSSPGPSAHDATSSAKPPPPPPPPSRRRQSNQSSPPENRGPSTTLRQTSVENHCKRRTSVASESSLRPEYAPVEQEDGAAVAMAQEAMSGSILDDMERFQREIDELRTRCQ